jgi:hypothetical protein
MVEEKNYRVKAEKKIYACGNLWEKTLTLGMVLVTRYFGCFNKTFQQFIVHQTQKFMNITFEELRRIKHALPQGSIARIAQELQIEEQTVRNYFGAHQYKDGEVIEFHLEPGPDGGIVYLEDTTILEHAKKIIEKNS